MKVKLFLVTVLSLLIFIFALFQTQPKENVIPAVGEDLPIVGSVENFQKLLKEMVTRNEPLFGFRNGVMMEEAKQDSSAAPADSGSGGDYSTTNVQVDGVDEADRVKTDGKFIYQLRDEQLIISEVNPVNDMKIVYNQRFNINNYYPHEFFVDDKHLVLIGYRSTHEKNEYKTYTHISVYELRDRSNLTLVREAEVEGYYLSSRKINNSLYIVSNQGLPYHIYESRPILQRSEEIEKMKPSYRDTAIGSETKKVEWDEMYYFPGSNDSNYLMVAGIDLANLDKPMSLSTYLGAGQTIYSSKENLYVTRTHYQYPETTMEKMATMIMPAPADADTLIYKFKLDNGSVQFLAEGKVKGVILNQFSMDEHKGHFRIATTHGNMWSETNPSENLLFILDEKLNEVGSIKNIAPGERIYSARFMGDRGYIVTFKQVDPLFVLDLANPKKPTILGELKIPGFSDYLHPYDENHIIGFGRDTIENDMGGAVIKGFKMALFDITDVTKPKEKFVEIIGGSGTYSELLYNHKALLFSKEKNIIAFPIELYEDMQQQNNMNDRFIHSPFAFQGAYVWGLDLEKGFQLKARISHYDKAKLTDNDYDYQKHVSRMLYIDNHLYTISNHKIEAHDLDDFNKQGQLIFGK